MKILIQRIKKIIRSNKGETIVESIVSLLILSILMLAVTTIIQTALKMTSVSIQNAKETQDVLNIIAQAEYSDSEPAEITFSASDISISATHNTILNKDGGIIAFSPPKSSAEPEEHEVGPY